MQEAQFLSKRRTILATKVFTKSYPKSLSYKIDNVNMFNTQDVWCKNHNFIMYWLDSSFLIDCKVQFKQNKNLNLKFATVKGIGLITGCRSSSANWRKERSVNS